jgi:hypothetical protein
MQAQTDYADEQGRFSRAMNDAQWCASFPAPDSVETLAGRGIEINQLMTLVKCLAKVGHSWDFRESREESDRESLIAARARELVDLVRNTDHGNGWCHAWDSDYEGIETSVEIDQLSDDLETLARNAEQRLEQFLLVKTIGLHPQSSKVRYFYWMSLIVFWKFVLCREVKASDNGRNRPSGPLVAFIETMSFGMTGSAVTPGAIRKFIERHRDEIDKFARTFLPSLVVRLHFLANGR